MALLQRLPHIGRKPLLTGLDSAAIRSNMVRLKARQGGCRLVNFGVMPLPARSIVDHTIEERCFRTRHFAGSTVETCDTMAGFMIHRDPFS